MKLTHFKDINFLAAIKALFKEMNVPMNYVADEPTTAKEILKDTYKENETFQLIGDVYFVGMVDDAAFEGNQSLEMEKIKSDYDGILIFGVTMHPRPNNLLPTRSQLAEISRAFNREFYYTPVVLVFKYKDDQKEYLAFANTERLKYKQEWREGEKAGKVSLLRDIDIQKPHAGHERIIAELQIPLTGRNAVDSFAKLYNYWQEVFNVSILNKKFYQELSNWYFWAINHVRFPSEPTIEDAHRKEANLDDLIKEHNATNVIRLLTRLLFTWFIKEKKLVPDELFDLDALQKDILNEISPYHENGMFKDANKESVYYKAILQNLFFASLNCPIEADETDSRVRQFRGDESYGKHRGIDWMMRYKKYFKNPDAFLQLLNKTVPFLNGGLFECLDDKTQNIYIDGFSDHMTKGEQLIVPDYLFFGATEHVDLSPEYGVKNKGTKQAAVKGLINILHSYKFTVTENTPVEEDVALDPELLGKVFENLLASYNPETKTTARKQTGSFYTPREIVNYMVDESLFAYLKNAVTDWNLNDEELDQKLHQLSSFDPGNPFAEDEKLTKKIVKAIDECKILDPACGSGAFPMGILQKMVHMLQKLDPENIIWKEVQKNKAKQAADDAFEIEDKEERSERLREIDEAFDRSINDPDYARKLYLIENCIYGVDIQPIATQISKLRFFISLVVDQRKNEDKPNFGIRALPNLETKFVAANTLIGVKKDQSLFYTDEIKSLEIELRQVRQKMFGLKDKKSKLRWRKRDAELRKKMAEVLKEQGLPLSEAEKLAAWDPYDQNATSTFFDPEWMFDISEGFDVVIGNPPYVLLQERIKDKVDLKWIRESFSVASYKVDLYHLFYEKGIEVLNSSGVLTYISPTNFLLNNYTKDLRKLLLKSKLSKILLIKYSVFEASVDTSVFTINRGDNTGKIIFSDAEINFDKINIQERVSIDRSIYEKDDFVINPEFDPETLEIVNQIAHGSPLGSVASVNFGMQLRNRKNYPIDVIHNPLADEITEYHKECYTGRDIKEFYVNYDNRYCFFNRVAKSGGCWDEKVQLANPKILVPQIGKFPMAGIDNKGYAVLNTAFLIVPFKPDEAYSLMALINSPVIKFYWSKKYYDQRQTFPKIKGTYLKELPLPEGYQKKEVKTLSEIISFSKDSRKKSIRDVLDSAVIELYFPGQLKENQINILEFVERDMQKVLQGREFGNLDDAEKEKVIERLHAAWSDPENEVVKCMAHFKEKSPEILKPILEG